MPEFDDKELFESAISDEPIAEIVTETPVATPDQVTVEATDGIQRDDKGRFAPKEQDTPAVTPAPQEPPQAAQNEAHVPSWRLREVNEAREAAERRAQEASDRAQAIERQLAQFQQQQPKPEAPDVFADPQGWQSHIERLHQQSAETQKFNTSEMLARQHFGEERVNEAEKWAAANVGPAEKARIANSRHPYAELVRMMDERKVLSEIGTDPNAYVQKKLDDALNDPAFLAKAAERLRAQASGQASHKPESIVQLPPSLNRATSSASPHDESGDLSNASLYAHATR